MYTFLMNCTCLLQFIDLKPRGELRCLYKDDTDKESFTDRVMLLTKFNKRLEHKFKVLSWKV